MQTRGTSSLQLGQLTSYEGMARQRSTLEELTVKVGIRLTRRIRTGGEDYGNASRASEHTENGTSWRIQKHIDAGDNDEEEYKHDQTRPYIPQA